MRPFVIALVMLMTLGRAVASSPDEVIQWTKAGTSDEQIIARLRKSPVTPALDAMEVLRLKNSGVSDAVLRAIIGTKPPEPPKVVPPPVVPESHPIATIDDIIAASQAGMEPAELTMRVRGLRLRIFHADRLRMLAASVPEEVIRAASMTPPAQASAAPDVEPDRFGRTGTFVVGFAGGLSSVHSGDVTVTIGRLAPSFKVLLGRFAAIGLDADITVGNGAGHTGLFASVGAGIPTRGFLIGLAALLGETEGAFAYGFDASLLARNKHLLLGAGVRGVWFGEPVGSVIGIDLRIGAWF